MVYGCRCAVCKGRARWNLRDSCSAEIVDFRPQVVRRHVDRRKCDGQPEAAPARASWIQVEHAGRLDLRHMGVTGHDDVDAARDRIDLQSLQIVQN
jgi:hypothetical protein